MQLSAILDDTREKFKQNPWLFFILLLLGIVVIFLMAQRGREAKQAKATGSKPKTKTIREVHYVPQEAAPPTPPPAPEAPAASKVEAPKGE